jgi:hypothetical protein
MQLCKEVVIFISMGIGDWGLGIGPIPNPQSPIPNPHWKKSRDLNRRMVEQDPYKGVTWTEFMLLYAEIEEVEEKKAQMKKELEKTLIEQNKAL